MSRQRLPALRHSSDDGYDTVLVQLGASLLIGGGAVAIGCLIERRWPAKPPRLPATLLNLGHFAATSGLHALMIPTLAGLVALGVNRMGGGLITLSSRGWGFPISLLGYALIMDFGEYVFHRAQHASPILWSMHSLHHSDDAFNVSTTLRHFWLDHMVKTVTIYLAAGLLFKTNLAILACYGSVTLYNYLTHLNVRVGFGRWSWLLNSPQYHRLHHSRLENDVDCNFAALFPVFDVIFRCYRRPGRDEYPPTGLSTRIPVTSVGEALVWPLFDLSMFRKPVT